MAVPVYTKTWVQALTGGVPGLRIAFVSVLDATQNVAFKLKDFLINSSTATTKYTLLWSASNGTGPTNSSDHTDRITNAAAWTPRATIAAASQAWMVLVDANGGQILIAFQGASDDILRISFSPSGLFTLAATTNQQPTATDEQVILSAKSIVNATASADRILHLWARDDGKGFRVAIARSNAAAAPVWWIEEFSNLAVQGISGVTVSPAICGGVVDVPGGSGNGTNLNGAFSANALGALVRAVISSVTFSVQCMFATLTAGAVALGADTSVAHLQGSAWVPFPLFLFSTTTNAHGSMGQLIDHYQVQPTSSAFGNGFGTTYQWWQVAQGLIWPNPSNTAPTIN